MIWTLVTARASPLSQHQAHVLAIGIPVLMVVVGLTWDALRKSARRPRETLPLSTPLLLAAFASLAAAAVHLAVAPEHFRESGLYGAFFVSAAAAQIGAALVIVLWRSRLLTGMVAGGNAVVILLWLATRLVGIPLGPDAGAVEPFQRLDVTASSCEAIVVICCVAALHRLARVGRRVPAL